MHTRRQGRLTGATSQRLLDGGDGPSPLPQLLAAATAPATAAELLGEVAARAAFRSSTHSAPLPHHIARGTPVQATSAVMIAKVIAAITLTASTAGGIALATKATTATPTHHATRTTSGSTTTSADAEPPLVITSTLTSSLTGLDDVADSDRAGGTPGARPADDTAGTVHVTPSRGSAHVTGRCRALTNLPDADRVGTATDSPAFADLGCTRTDTATGSTRPTGRPEVAPGNPDQRTGKPDTTGEPNDDIATDTHGKSEKAREDEEASDAQDNIDGGSSAVRGKSGEHRQNG